MDSHTLFFGFFSLSLFCFVSMNQCIYVSEMVFFRFFFLQSVGWSITTHTYTHTHDHAFVFFVFVFFRNRCWWVVHTYCCWTNDRILCTNEVTRFIAVYANLYEIMAVPHYACIAVVTRPLGCDCTPGWA